MSASQTELAVDEDASLVLAAQNDPTHFLALYDRWATRVYRYFLHRLGQVAAAEDLTSALFLSAYQALPRYRHRGHFPAWLFTIARNLLVEHYRKRQHEVPFELARHLTAASEPAADFDRDNEIQLLVGLVRRLPEAEQELIRLRYVAGLSFADMGVVVNKRPDAVKKSLYRLQARLQSLLEADHA
ncbi:MAG: sigma-70 family RNA polymerase sigma factor [Anaerolineales bacterium]|nr:sigma-70 family RNA polymerase sigma factor [Anaerolineales bacterium]